MRLNKQNKIIVGVLALLLTLTVGYAVFSQSMNITGTAEASGNFSLIFSSIGTIKEEGSSGTTADIISEGKTLSVKVPNLQYPSAYAKINATITNDGTVKAILKEIAITDKEGNSYNNSDIKITYSNIKINDIFEPNESKDVAIIVTWDKDSTNSKVDVSFNISLKYEQATSLADSGSGDTDAESDWTFRVNDTGLITAYNYEKGTDVVVPAYVDGIAVTTITEDSFKQESNLIAYMDEDAGKMYMVIKDEQNFSVIKDKVMLLLSSECDEGDTECLDQYKQMIYICKDENTCYNVKAEEEGNAEAESISQTVIENGAEQMVVDTDPDVSLEDSFNEATVNISTLDLSQATNLTAIEEDSFYKAGLQSVNFGENSNLKTIGASAFYGNEISELIIPESVEEIGNSAFSSNNITSVTFKQNDNTLANNSNIKASYLSDSTNNKTSKLVENSTGLKTIGNSAFSSNQISSIKLPDTITSIGSYAFYQNQLTSITIPNNVITIGENAFYENQISKLLFEENSSLGIIGNYAFQNNQISELIIPNSVTSIGYSAFDSNQISRLTIPKTVETIRMSAFYNNPIETLSIGKCTTSICNQTEFGTKIKTLTIESGEIKSYAFDSSDGTGTIESLTLGNGVTTIGENAFSSNQISELEIPNSVTSIGYAAFSSNQISKIEIPNSVTTIGNNAFKSNQISNLIFEENSKLETIGEEAFYSNQISTLEIPNSVTSLNGFGDNQLTSITIPSSVTTIGYAAFSSNQISELEIPNSVTSIGYAAFSSNQISKIEIPNSVTTIGNNAFKSNQISNLIFEENSKLETIGEMAFDSNQISTLEIPNSVTNIGGWAFYENQISSLTIPNSVTSIGNFVFGYNKISELIIPNSVTSIGNFAFKSNQISSLEIPNSVTTIGDYAFSSNPLTSILIKRTEEDFLSNVTVGSGWYSNSPTITYEP